MKLKENVYNRNLNAIKKVSEQLANWIDKGEKISWVDTIQNTDGSLNLLIRSGSKIEATYDQEPKKEAAKVAKQTQLNKEDCTLIIGAGLGYLSNALLHKMEKGHHIVIIEPIPYLLKLMLSNFDYAKYIENGLLFFACVSKEDINFTISILDSSFVIQNWFILIEKYAKLREEYNLYISYTIDLINQYRCNTGTVMGAGAQIADNDIVSLPYVIRHRGINEIKGLFKDKPAILVSTGPSLVRNIHLLKDIQDKVIIIAVGQALRILLAYDIRPDFICTVDFGETNLGHYKGLLDSDIPLVCLNRTYAPLLKQYKGPKFIISTPVPGYENTVAGLLENKGCLEQGGSVAHTCYSLAYHLGCDPIVLIGQDLSLSETSHFNQTDESGTISLTDQGEIKWNIKDHRSHLNNKEPYSMGLSIFVPGYYGSRVLTNIGLASFITSFESMTETFSKDRTIINSTEGGAKIKGMKQLILSEVIKQYCEKNFNKDISKYLTLSEDGEKLINKAIPLLEKEIKLFTSIIINSEKALHANKNIEKYIGNEPKMKEWMKKNETYSIKANELSKKNSLITVAIYGASRKILDRDLNVDGKVDHLLSSKKDLKIRLNRNNIILNAAKNAAELLKKSYVASLNTLKVYMDTKDENLLISTDVEEIDLDDADTYFDKGNWVHPLVDARKYLYHSYLNIKTEEEFKNRELTDPILNPLSCNKYIQARKIEQKALKMREESIQKAIENYKEDNSKLLKYNELINLSKELGKEEAKKKDRDFTKSLELLKEAVKLYPDREEALWGLATALHHTNQFNKSIEVYKKLVEKYPDIHQYRFELGQVLMNTGKIQEGLKEIAIVMKKSTDYDSFFARLGQLYEESGLYEEALESYTKYLSKYKLDYFLWKIKGDLFRKMNKIKEANDCYQEAKGIKPDLNIEI